MGRTGGRFGELAGALVALGLVLSGCSGDGDASLPGTTVAALDPGSPMRSDLLRIEEVRTLADLGFDLRPQPVLDRAQFDVAALVGPCGRPVPTPFSTGPDAVRVFRSTQSLVVVAATDAGPAAPGLVASLREQARPGCTFTEQRGGTPVEGTGEVLPSGPEAGNEHLVWQHDLRAPDGKVTRRLVALYRGGGRLLLVGAVLDANVNRTVFGEVVERAIRPPAPGGR